MAGGLHYPFEEDPSTGDLRRAEGRDSIRSNVLALAEMGRQEVSGSEGDGAGIRRALFGDAVQLRKVAMDLKLAVVRGERRVRVVDVAVDTSIPRKGKVVLTYVPVHSSESETVALQQEV